MELWEIERAEQRAVEELNSAGIDPYGLRNCKAEIISGVIVWSNIEYFARDRFSYVTTSAIYLWVLAQTLRKLVENRPYEMPEKVARRWAELCLAIEHLKVVEKFEKERQSEKGKSKRGHEGDLKRTLRMVGSYEDLMRIMSDRDCIDDFNEAEGQAAPLILQEMTDKRFYYRTRKSGVETSVTLEHVKRFFRDINKPN